MSHNPSKKPRLTSDSNRLPDDVVFDLLNRLPVKSIVRFRCVSKPWNAVVTDPMFIATNFKLNLSNSLSSNNDGYVLYVAHSISKNMQLGLDFVTVVCNNDHTFTEVSRVTMPPTGFRMVGFCNGILYLDLHSKSPYFPVSQTHLWNTSIRKDFYLNSPRHLYPPRLRVAVGFAYHSHDFKFVRILCFERVLGAKPAPAMAEVFTLSTRSQKNLVVSVDSLTRIEPNGSISDIVEDPFLFFNGALHSLAYTTEGNKFILSFDFNDERFREITLPGDYLDGLTVLNLEHLAVFKGSLALIAFGEFEIEMDDDTGIVEICHIWEMKEYGDVKSWTKKIVFLENVKRFFGCTHNGDLLIETTEGNWFSVDPENEEKYDLGIQRPGIHITP